MQSNRRWPPSSRCVRIFRTSHKRSPRSFTETSGTSWVKQGASERKGAQNCNIGSNALAAEICAGPHNRLLRRQHCSSLCSQSEGHEHVANMANALAHDVVGFLALFGRHNIRPPHFASKVSYSVAPHSLPPAIRVIRPSAFKIFAAKPLKPGNHLAISLKTRNFAPLIKYNHN